MNILDKINSEATKKEVTEFNVGDTVNIDYKVIEGGKERIQAYQGIVIAINNSGVAKTFTVRKLSYGTGVERVFPYYSPNVANIKVIRRGKVRRSKLYYLRQLRGKKAKVKELKR